MARETLARLQGEDSHVTQQLSRVHRWAGRRIAMAGAGGERLYDAAQNHAQGAASSTIHGSATDETGAAMPGVTVTLTSPHCRPSSG